MSALVPLHLLLVLKVHGEIKMNAVVNGTMNRGHGAAFTLFP